MAPVEGEARDHHLLTKDVEEVVIVVVGVEEVGEEVGEEEVAAVADRNLPEATEVDRTLRLLKPTQLIGILPEPAADQRRLRQLSKRMENLALLRIQCQKSIAFS